MPNLLHIDTILKDELHSFALEFSRRQFSGKEHVKMLDTFIKNLMSYYGVSRDHILTLLGLDKHGLKHFESCLEEKKFKSYTLDQEYVNEEARKEREHFLPQGYRYETNVKLPQLFKEREHLLEQFADVRIGGPFFPMNAETYVPGWVSLWVKED